MGQSGNGSDSSYFERAALRFLRRAEPGTPVPDRSRSSLIDGVWIFRDEAGQELGRLPFASSTSDTTITRETPFSTAV